ncbi:hypothetical protein Dsin_019521 [Dipteronia sinensis]|uniref:RNase H type-1 domain-containing protein n=1 Tax=Dipteronia sinensis TaxID=43782 RepID=A0AAE0A7Q2_9ROSI|nr:hypothetical protein Dsin_019521 [Dipteronia sinensis]
MEEMFRFSTQPEPGKIAAVKEKPPDPRFTCKRARATTNEDESLLRNPFSDSFKSKLLSTTYKVDPITESQARGRFDRIYVELDITKPLKSSLDINDRVIRVEYESLGLICFQCGRVWQSKDSYVEGGVIWYEYEECCGFWFWWNLGKYLGVPLIHSRVSSQTYGEVIEKVQQGLAAWKTTPMMRNLCTFSSGMRFVCLKPVVNWCKLFKSKYLNSRNFFDLELSKGWFVLALGKLLLLVLIWLKWRVGSGEQIRFWTDDWVPDMGVLYAHAFIVLSKDILSQTVIPHGKILTNYQIVVRGLGSVTLRPACEATIKDIDHLLRGCKYSIAIWESLFKGVSSSASFVGDLDVWFLNNLKNDSKVFGKISLCLLFASMVWFIWKWRCKKVFEPDFVTRQNLYQCISRFCCDWLDTWMLILSAAKYAFLVSISWSPPSIGWVKLNVDGSCDTNFGSITVGGMLMDHRKKWLRGFVFNKGVGSALEAELGLFEGLIIAWNVGFQKIIVESDSLSVVQLLSKGIHVNHPLINIATDCSALIVADWCCILNHVYRERDRLADALAYLGYNMDFGCQLFDVPLSEICKVFQDDWSGFASSRMCSLLPPLSAFLVLGGLPFFVPK